MSDDEEGHTWEDNPGAFPRGSPSSTSKGHIFTDEPFETNFYSTSLSVVDEGSKGTQMTGNSEQSSTVSEDLRAFSNTSSDTPAIDTATAEAALRKIKALQQQQQGSSQLGKQGSSPASSSAGVYPFNIYQSLAGYELRKDRNRDAEQGSNKNGQSSSNPSLISTSSRSSSSKRVEIVGDGPSGLMTSPMTPMSEECSVISDQQSHLMENASVHPPYSVMSRRPNKRYLVRHTLSTNQVNAHPATMLKNLFIGIDQERHMHKLAAQNLSAVHNWMLFLPSILLTLLSGVVALVFEADLDATNETRVYASIFVGVTALLSVFSQAVSKMLDFSTRGTLHEVTATALKRISEDILLTLSSTEAITPEYVSLIGDKFAQAMDGCTSRVPYKIETAFSAVSDRMVLMLKPPMGQPPRKYVHKLDFMRLYATAYDELTTEIIHHWAWPFALPQSRAASDAALRNFKAIITEGREASHKNKGCLRIICPCVADDPVERSLFEVVPTASIADNSIASTHNPYQIRNAMLGQEI